jgi:hypothetical protein
MLEEELRNRKDDGDQSYLPGNAASRGMQEQLELSRETIKDLNNQIQLRN